MEEVIEKRSRVFVSPISRRLHLVEPTALGFHLLFRICPFMLFVVSISLHALVMLVLRVEHELSELFHAAAFRHSFQKSFSFPFPFASPLLIANSSCCDFPFPFSFLHRRCHGGAVLNKIYCLGFRSHVDGVASDHGAGLKPRLFKRRLRSYNRSRAVWLTWPSL